MAHVCSFSVVLLALIIGSAICETGPQFVVNTCPCSTPSLCDPITTPARKEVYIFMLEAGKDVWSKFDWDKVTTIAIVGFYDPELLCYAHSKGVRIVNLSSYPSADLLDEAKRAEWIREQVADAQSKFLDGLNIDTEDEIPENSNKTEALTSLVNETRDAFTRAIPGSQVTFDIAWSPDHIDDRWYDAVRLSEVADFLFVMSYDEQSQIFDSECTARANSGLPKTVSGLERFKDLGINSSKLVLGVPWYGYDYPCTALNENNTCYIKSVPFRGVNCSDAAGTQIPYSSILTILNTSSITGRLWDEQSKSPYFNFQNSDHEVHQMWYDDPQSLQLKYTYAVDNDLRGVGMWTGNFLDYNDSEAGQEERSEMWGALPKYN